MNQIQFETNGLTVLACRVPSDSSPSFVMRDRITFDYWDDNSGMWMPDYIILPEGDWKLHAVTDSMTYGHAQRLVEKQGDYGYRSYDNDSFALGLTFYVNPIHSLHSLLRSYGIDPAEKWVLLVCE